MKPQLSVLLVEDDPNVRLGCEQAMQLAGIAVDAVASAEEAQRRLMAGFPGIVVTDMRLPGADGMALLRWVVERDADLPVIIITGHGDVTLAVEAMRSGAYDFMQKPFSTGDLIEVVRRALEKRELVLEVEALRRRLDHRDDLESRLIGRSPQMAKVRQLILDVAGAAVDVLIFGETGTGKEMVARCLHDLSHPGQDNYVAINCGGMADNLLDSELFGHEPGAFTGAQKRRIGKIEYASGGTLFLDELESMPMSMQIKLLRVLQERVIERLGSNQLIPVNCRVIAANKEALKTLSDQGKFRADLYYRLNVVRIEPPALPSECLRRLMAQDWPGNIRELRNAADCHALGIGLDAVASSAASAPQSLTEAVDNYERLLITREFTLQDGNIARTSEALKVARTTLYDKLKKYGLI